MSAGGMFWTVQAAAGFAASTAIAAATSAAAIAENQATALANASVDGYRPSGWSLPAQTFVTVPGTAGSSSAGTVNTTPQDGTVAADTGVLTFGASSTLQQGTPDTILVFDAVIRLEHGQGLRKTEHPVQAGANIADHAFLLPASVVLDIGMSDAMDSYQPGMWGGAASKSVSAFQTLLAVQASRKPLTVTTRLNTYVNMLIDHIHAPDSNETGHGLKATVTFGQIFTGSVTTQQVSARPQTTGATEIGTKNPLPVPATVTNQNMVTTPTTVPGAGDFSSDPGDLTGFS